MVATLFVPNPEGKKFVNHLNGDKTFNWAVNFAWTTHAENVKHAHDTGLIPSRRMRRAVIDKCRNRRYNGVAEAARHTGIPVSTCRQYLVGTLPNPTCLRFANE
jgi:hypothetical protein